ncbi:MAG: hypothetical protein CM15mP49_38630 [Actinomycetota bacterium]|nr:MAG: hypothetical protein CM15mP49_38630 [Actinomycetota bacterium]
MTAAGTGGMVGLTPTKTMTSACRCGDGEDDQKATCMAHGKAKQLTSGTRRRHTLRHDLRLRQYRIQLRTKRTQRRIRSRPTRKT